jgi:hypothetical protein
MFHPFEENNPTNNSATAVPPTGDEIMFMLKEKLSYLIF